MLTPGNGTALPTTNLWLNQGKGWHISQQYKRRLFLNLQPFSSPSRPARTKCWLVVRISFPFSNTAAELGRAPALEGPLGSRPHLPPFRWHLVVTVGVFSVFPVFCFCLGVGRGKNIWSLWSKCLRCKGMLEWKTTDSNDNVLSWVLWKNRRKKQHLGGVEVCIF